MAGWLAAAASAGWMPGSGAFGWLHWRLGWLAALAAGWQGMECIGLCWCTWEYGTLNNIELPPTYDKILAHQNIYLL